MKVIAIDTSNKTMAVALADEGKVIAVKKINIKRNHSIQLMPAIQELLNEVNWQSQDIDRIAVANGPGSYTGVRIAVTTAKTLAWSLNADLVPYSSLEALVIGQSHTYDAIISPIFDARRGNVYAGLYQINQEGKLETVVSDRHIDFETWMTEIISHDTPIVFVGEDVDAFSEMINNNKSLSNLVTELRNNELPQVGAMAIDAPNRTPISTHQLTPDYLKLTEAEENWMKDNPDSKRGHLVEKIERSD